MTRSDDKAEALEATAAFLRTALAPAPACDGDCDFDDCDGREPATWRDLLGLA